MKRTYRGAVFRCGDKVRHTLTNEIGEVVKVLKGGSVVRMTTANHAVEGHASCFKHEK